EIYFNDDPSNNNQNQIEIHTTNRQKISFSNQNDSVSEKIIITKLDKNSKGIDDNNNSIIINPSENSLSIIGDKMNLNIKVQNLSIEATENITLNAKSTTRINGKMVCIN